MKKTVLLSALVFALGFTACDDYTEPNPPAQSNAQESILQTDQVEVTNALNGVYNLADLSNGGTSIEIAQILCDALPEAYNFVANVEISNNGFATSSTVESTVERTDENTYAIMVSPDALQGVYYQNISKDPGQNTISARVNIMTQIEKQIAYVGGQNNYYGPYELTLKPFAAGYVIEDAYYLVSSADNWNVKNAVRLKNSGISPYDDPVFAAAIDLTAAQVSAGYEWKVIPASTYAAGTMDGNVTYGVDGMTGAMEGALVLNGANGVITESGQYLFTVNMENNTYSITSAVPFLYTPGDANGWSQGASQMLYTNDYTNYYGYAVLSPGGFKFTTAPDWDHINFGDGGSAGILSTDGGAGNLSVSTAGLYWCHVNTTALTYEVTLIETMGVIGDATPGGWDASTALQPSADYLTWTGKITFGAGEFKFRANNGWDINLGGNLQDLVQDGANIASPGAGTYTVTLNLSQLPYSAQIQ